MLLNILNFVFDCNLSEFDCIFLFLTMILGNRALLVFPWMKSLHWMPTLPINRRRAMQCKEWNWTDDESNFKSQRNAFINVDRLRQTFSSSSAPSFFSSSPSLSRVLSWHETQEQCSQCPRQVILVHQFRFINGHCLAAAAATAGLVIEHGHRRVMGPALCNKTPNSMQRDSSIHQRSNEKRNDLRRKEGITSSVFLVLFLCFGQLHSTSTKKLQ